MPDALPAASEVLVRYFAGAAAAAGRGEERVVVPAGATAADLVTQLAAAHPALTPVLQVASLLVDEVAVADRAELLASPDGGPVRQVDVLPPFAGG